jgi:hypothetical protein
VEEHQGSESGCWDGINVELRDVRALDDWDLLGAWILFAIIEIGSPLMIHACMGNRTNRDY